jgi:hypothetical protein
LLEAEDERLDRIAWLRTEVEKGFSGPVTPWSKKDADRVRRLISKASRKSR